jgi:pyrroloquinoline quinone (PQQ) biosynthesis protein C
MDIDDLKRMREDKRREWLREQEKTVQEHNNEMLKTTLDAIREAEEED